MFSSIAAKFHRHSNSSRPASPSSDLGKDVKHPAPINKNARSIRRLLKLKRPQPKSEVIAFPTRVSTAKLGINDSEGAGEQEAITIISYNPSNPILHSFRLANKLGAYDGFNLQDPLIGGTETSFKIHLSPTSGLSDPQVLTPNKLLHLLNGQFKAAAGEYAGCPSGQKRPSGDDGKQGKKGKKQKGDGNKNNNHDNNSGDGAEGDGSGGNGGAGGGGRNPNKPDGHRFPKPEEPPDDELFECPFYRQDPDRYQKCKGHRMRRFCDVKQHVDRMHRLKADNVYCSWCRIEFHGAGRYARQIEHERVSTGLQGDASKRHEFCPKGTIKSTGLILPVEYAKIEDAIQSCNSNPVDKWNKVWEECFSLPHPPSPYVQTVASRRRWAESTLTEVLAKSLRTHGSRLESVVSDILNHMFPSSSPVTPPTSDAIPTGNPPKQPVQQQPTEPPASGANMHAHSSSQTGSFAPQPQLQPHYPLEEFDQQAASSFGSTFMNPGDQLRGSTMSQGYPASNMPFGANLGMNDTSFNPSPNVNYSFQDPSIYQLLGSIDPSLLDGSARSGGASQFPGLNDNFSRPNFSGSNNPQQRRQ